MSALLIGIAGGTGSGKTTVAHRIASFFKPYEVVLVDQDSYYRDLSHLPFGERRRVNYDHPSAFDIDLLVSHLQEMKQNRKIEKPIYSYKNHCRTKETTRLEPAPIILLEAILVLESKRLRDEMDIMIFVDTDDDIRFIRRLRRDVHERGRDLDSVIAQYEHTVRPMHLSFILPSKRHADLVIPRGGENEVAIRMVVATLREQLRNRDKKKPETFIPSPPPEEQPEAYPTEG